LNWHIKEFVAALIVIIFIAAVPYAIFGNAPWVNEKSMRVMHLTAVTEDGVWTDAKVNAGNYWSKKLHYTTKRGKSIITIIKL
jgi:hypothetical protein